jgi:alkaline phosphatase D
MGDTGLYQAGTSSEFDAGGAGVGDDKRPGVRVATESCSGRGIAVAVLGMLLAFVAGQWSVMMAPKAPSVPPAHQLVGAAARGGGGAWAPLPADDTLLEKIAFGSCADQKYPAPFWDTIAKLDPAFFIYGGDNVYGDATGDVGRRDLSPLVAAYNGLSEHPSFIGSKGRLPILPIWDDHDYGLNDGGADFELRDETKQLFLDFYDIPPEDPRSSRPGLYHSYSFGPAGQRVQVILLDQRYFRGSFKSASAADRANYTAGRERYLVDPASTETILGEAQWAWLEEQFLQPASVRIVVASFQLAVAGHGFERWGLIPAELQRFYDLIESTRAKGVIVLSGDRHIGAIYKEAGGRPYTVGGVTDGPFNVPYPIYEM